MMPSVQHLVGDCRVLLPTIPDASVQCCVTSPPYWGLRDYGTAKWEGGDSGCDHKFSVSSPYNANFNERWGNSPGLKKQESQRHEVAYKDACGKCGAKRIDSQIGLEPTPEAYVETMRAVFRGVWRVLKDDGVLFLNLGDTYYGGGNYRGCSELSEKQASNGGAQGIRITNPPTLKSHPILKPKDLVGIPWRVAFALQADGWYLRSDIIWHKPNPMPESVTDRPTKSHEYIFLLTKSERYFYDAEAIREDNTQDMQRRAEAGHTRGANGKLDSSRQDSCSLRGPQAMKILAEGRNKRSVWTVTTQPYSDAHFATFPPDLIKPCILAGTKAGDTVLDPFGGSGTTGMVAVEHGRNAILIELNPEYDQMAKRRCCVTPPLFA